MYGPINDCENVVHKLLLRQSKTSPIQYLLGHPALVLNKSSFTLRLMFSIRDMSLQRVPG